MKDRPHFPAPAGGAEILAGPHAILEALRSDRRALRRILLARQERSGITGAVLGLARERAVPVEARTRADLDRLIQGGTHQGIVAEVGPFPYVEVDAILSRAIRGPEAPFIVSLDGIQDPQNLGAILRSAEAAGVHGVILPRDRAAGVTPAAVRASAGAAEHLAVARVTNLAAFLGWAKERDLWVVGADPAEGQLLYDADLREPLVLVIGAEERGLRPVIKSRCDLMVRIPVGGRVGSLNASSAAAVCIFEVIRQRLVVKAGSD